MGKRNDRRLAWWLAIDAAEALYKIQEDPFILMSHRIHEFQYELWEMCGSPVGEHPDNIFNLRKKR